MASTGGGELRVAAAADIHCREGSREQVVSSFSELDGMADIALLAGDLTTHGTIEEAEILATAAEATSVPLFAVLGNHDWHAGQSDEIVELLSGAGVNMLDRGARTCEVTAVEVGVAGCKGFVGGFAPRHLPDFGEPSLRALYAETTAEVEALDSGLHEIAACPVRVVVLHYSPVEATLDGEPREIFPLLGSDRLAAPILEHGPDLVVHGHAHDGAAEGRIGEVPVLNVSVHVTGVEFRLVQLEVGDAHSPIP